MNSFLLLAVKRVSVEGCPVNSLRGMWLWCPGQIRAGEGVYLSAVAWSQPGLWSLCSRTLTRIENWKRENVLLDALPLNSVFSEPHQSNMCLKRCVWMASCTYYLKIAQDIIHENSCFVELFFIVQFVTNQQRFKSKWSLDSKYSNKNFLFGGELLL